MPGLFEILSDVLPQSSFMSSITLIQPITIISLNNINGVFRRVRKIAKSDCQLRHVCPSIWNNSAPTAWIFKKFDV